MEDDGTVATEQPQKVAEPQKPVEQPQLKEVRKPDAPTAQNGAEAVQKVAKTAPDRIAPEEQMSALAWLLSDDVRDAPVGYCDLKLDVGQAEERWITWRVRSIDGDELRHIQHQVANSRAARAGRVDDLELHCQVVARATVEPDINQAVKQYAESHGHAGLDAPRFIRDRFSHKPGLVPQISAQIMELSGFDDAQVQVQEVEAGKG